MNLSDAQIAMLAENQYQELELWYPVLRLREAGAKVVVVAPSANQVYASKLGYPVSADFSADEVDPAALDGVVIPGGFVPEGMRRHKPMVDLVRGVHDQGYAWTPRSAAPARCWPRQASPRTATSPACR